MKYKHWRGYFRKLRRLNNDTLRNRYFMLRDGRPWWKVLWINLRLAAYLK